MYKTTPQESSKVITKLFDNLHEFQEFYLIKDNYAYKIFIGKNQGDIIIKCQNYGIQFTFNDLSILTKTIFNNIDESFNYIVKLFQKNKVKIKNIDINKTIKLLFKLYILNEEKDIEIILIYDKGNKDLIINEINNNYRQIKSDINFLKEEIIKFKIISKLFK